MKLSLIFLLLLFIAGTKPDNVITRFKPPAGYEQQKVLPGSFAAWLQQLPLKPPGAHTLTYKGTIAATDMYTAAVVDMSVGNSDLQQCADAVMRLRGEYLYAQKKYEEIAFHFTNGFRCDYLHYANGYRYRHNKWVLTAERNYNYITFMQYMRLVFMYANTMSLEKELKPVKNTSDLKTGDVFIFGGSPGHAMIIMDVVENSRHQKQFLLAQSFMPAQSIQILQFNGSPWFSLERHSAILYGEMISAAYLRQF
jgi:hypothetical protein